MNTKSYTEIENAISDDVGKIAVVCLGGPTLAIEKTLEDCIDSINNVWDVPITENDIETRTDRQYCNSGDLYAFNIVE